MKKNNKFRNNGNSNAYSLNYKFDSVSPAGKCSGTALDLIKRYNELAKEAHGGGDYIAMEVYRQYAEHYRKIVTEINERKNYRAENTAPVTEIKAETSQENETTQTDSMTETATTTVAPSPQSKAFEVIEIRAVDELPEKIEKTDQIKKTIRRRKTSVQPVIDKKDEIKSDVEAV